MANADDVSAGSGCAILNEVWEATAEEGGLWEESQEIFRFESGEKKYQKIFGPRSALVHSQTLCLQ